MNISEIEKLTGIPKQTIRFYEKEGLINPKRNSGNQYREYDDQDIKQLKQIYVLRKVGLSVLEIRQVLNQEITMGEAINARRTELLEEKEEQEKLLKLCDDLKIQSLEYMDADQYIEKIQEEKKTKKGLRQLYEEYKQIYKAEEKKEFMIMPDQMIYTAEDFTKALLEYAESIGADITITKEGLSPEFVLNGVEYSAFRYTTKFGHSIHCNMKHPELAEPDNVAGKKRIILQIIAKIGPIITIGVIMILLFLKDLTPLPIASVLIVISLIVFLVTCLLPWWNMGK